MNILHLKYAVEVAKAGSVNKAAEKLLMGQPNLSRAIKELEASLGITIFDRSARGMYVTPDGEKFLSYASGILRQIDEVENMYKTHTPEVVKFSISVPRASYISAAFSEFSKKLVSPRYEIFYKETNSLRAVKNILESDYKLGIIRYARKHNRYFMDLLAEKELTYKMVNSFSYVLIMRSDSPLASLKEIHFSDIKPYIEIAHADAYVPFLPFAAVKKEELPDDINKRIFVFERASQFELLSANNKTFMWVSPVSKSLLNKFGLVERTCVDNDKVYDDILIYRKNYTLSKLDNVFISELDKIQKEETI